MKPISELTIESVHEGLRNKEFSALEVAQAAFAQVKGKDAEIGAFLRTFEEQAIKQAEAVDLSIANGDSLPDLAGVPIALKDNMLVEGQIASAASKMLADYRSSYDAGVVTKLKAQKAVLMGSTNMDEFAMGSSTETSAFKKTRNPRDLERVPGGSSGGSAAAVAGDMAVAALGSDTGGSIRQPAGLCGVVGLKPTYGAVSRSGLIAMASSLDQIGPITKTVKDAAILFKGIAGQDPLDSTSVKVEYSPELLEPDFEKIKGLTLGIPNEYFVDGLSTEVATAVNEAKKRFEGMGVKFKPISLPHTKYALSCYYIIMPAEVSSNLARFDGIRYSRNVKDPANLLDLYERSRGEGFGPEVKRRIILGTYVLSSGYYDAYYGKAQQVRALIKQDFDKAFENVDAIFTPVAPGTAFKFGDKIDDPLSMYLEDIFTIPANLAGVPAISIPTGYGKGLPIGFQLIGKHFHEADILGLGQLYEKTI